MYKFRMKTWTLPLAAAGCLLAANIARANEQCVRIDETQAAKAQAILAERQRVLQYCEPCGDEAPGKPFIADTVETITPHDLYELSINGKSVDLAYIYVQITTTNYVNLATLVGCQADGVPPSLTIAAETPAAAMQAAATPTPETPPAAAPPIAAPESGLTAEITAMSRMSPTGVVHIYRKGAKIEKTTLRVFDAHGNLIKRVSIRDRGAPDKEKRAVGSWDLTNMNSRPVRYGTYSVKGTITTRDGNSEEVSLTIDVR